MSAKLGPPRATERYLQCAFCHRCGAYAAQPLHRRCGCNALPGFDMQLNCNLQLNCMPKPGQLCSKLPNIDRSGATVLETTAFFQIPPAVCRTSFMSFSKPGQLWPQNTISSTQPCIRPKLLKIGQDWAKLCRKPPTLVEHPPNLVKNAINWIEKTRGSKPRQN